MAFTCPANHNTDRFINYVMTCACGDTHDHGQLECLTCGHVRFTHPTELQKTKGDWAAANPEPAPEA